LIRGSGGAAKRLCPLVEFLPCSGCGGFMAFGMPETGLSSHPWRGECRKQRQLDMLVFGMPKTSRFISANQTSPSGGD
jgi:hypothetical protein